MATINCIQNARGKLPTAKKTKTKTAAGESHFLRDRKKKSRRQDIIYSITIIISFCFCFYASFPVAATIGGESFQTLHPQSYVYTRTYIQTHIIIIIIIIKRVRPENEKQSDQKSCNLLFLFPPPPPPRPPTLEKSH